MIETKKNAYFFPDPNQLKMNSSVKIAIKLESNSPVTAV